MTTIINEPQYLPSLVGHDLSSNTRLAIPRREIDLFAEATHGKQRIQVDDARAKTGRFKGPIALGSLSLSVLIPLWSEILVIENLGMAVNSGLNKVRYYL